MVEKHPKCPRDLNQWAKRMVDIATGEVSDREPTPPTPVTSPQSLGGKARATHWALVTPDGETFSDFRVGEVWLDP